jgi:type 1 glutamine amidotransferase
MLLVGSLVLAPLGAPACAQETGASAPPVRVLVVTGGHEYPTSFYTVFEHPGLAWDHAVSNEDAFRQDLRGRYDVVVLYDMSARLSDGGKGHLRSFVEGGGGVLVLHHAIVSYQDWPWYRECVGGRYVEAGPGGAGSSYLHDQDVEVAIAARHPVTEGVVLPRIRDETYKGLDVAPGNTVLLTTDHPASDRPLAWVSAYSRARVVYIQLGHGAEAHRDPGYRRLVLNAIRWTATR